jgi:hypothetical protein
MAYGKIDETFWHDKLMRTLPEASRFFVLYLLSCPHRNRLGCFVLDPFYAAADLQWPVEKVEEQLRILDEKGRVRYDPETRVLFLKRFLKHNLLENANVVKGAIKELSTIPDTPLLEDLYGALEENRRAHYHDILEALRNRLANRSPNGLPNHSPNHIGNHCPHPTIPYPYLDPDLTEEKNHTSSPTPVAGEKPTREDVDFKLPKVIEYQSLARENIVRIHGGTERDVTITVAGVEHQVGVGIDVLRYKRFASMPGQDPELVARAIRHLPDVTGLEPPVSLARWEADDGWAVFSQCIGLAQKPLTVQDRDPAYATPEPNDGLARGRKTA